MKSTATKLFALLLYIVILSLFEGWKMQIFFDVKLIIYFILGISILALFQNKKYNIQELFLPVGILYSCLLLFSQCGSGDSTDISYTNIILSFRPLFYAGFLSYALHTDKEPAREATDSETQSADCDSRLYFKLKEQGLTEREIEITRLAEKKLSNYAIAEELYITEATVKKHLSHIYEKLNVRNRKQLEEYIHVQLMEK